MYMGSHLTLSTENQYALDQGDTGGAMRDRIPTGDRQTGPSEAVNAQAQDGLASEPVWRHKLILMGKLDDRSTPELEDEIECLCEEGVTTITLDLRRLAEIDSAGATAIARRGAVCRTRGQEFAVIPGARVIRCALADAGATNLLMPDPEGNAARHFPSPSAEGSAAYRSTAMIKSL
jgi:ABC-type transporter Mla MlaB component